MKLKDRTQDNGSLKASYEAAPYLSICHPASSFERIEFLATLFKLQWPSTDLRVLEIGCASGGNLIPMAFRNPDVHFVGIDISETQISQANMLASKLDLTNISFEQTTIEQFHSVETFDYVVAHGVYSWVSEETRRALEQKVTSLLSAHGVLYISFDALPGTAVKQVIREMLLQHLDVQGQAEDFKQRSLSYLQFLISHAASTSQGLLLSIKEEYETIKTLDASHFVHDYLELYNSPFYHRDVCDRFSQGGLQYLCDPTLSFYGGAGIRNELKERFRELAGSTFEDREAFTDFFSLRRFRSNLFVKNELSFSRELSENSLPEDSHYLGLLSPIKGRGGVFWLRGSNEKIEIKEELARSALEYLGAIFPHSAKLDDILDSLPQKLHRRDNIARLLSGALLHCLPRRFVQAQLRLPRLSKSASSQLTVNALIRATATRQDAVPNAYHEAIYLNQEDKMIVATLPATACFSDKATAQKQQDQSTSEHSQRALRDCLKRLSEKALLYEC